MEDKKPQTLNDLVPEELQAQLSDFASDALLAMQKHADEDGAPMEMITLVLPRNMIESLIVEQAGTAAALMRFKAILGTAPTGLKGNSKALEHSVNAGLLLKSLGNYLGRKQDEDV